MRKKHEGVFSSENESLKELYMFSGIMQKKSTACPVDQFPVSH